MIAMIAIVCPNCGNVNHIREASGAWPHCECGAILKDMAEEALSGPSTMQQLIVDYARELSELVDEIKREAISSASGIHAAPEIIHSMSDIHRAATFILGQLRQQPVKD